MSGLANIAAARGIELGEVTARVEGDIDLLGIFGLDDSVRNGFETSASPSTSGRRRGRASSPGSSTRPAPGPRSTTCSPTASPSSIDVATA